MAYLVTRYDQEADESRSALWSADWAHGERRPLTHGESVWEPRFSPDGRYLSFLAARPADSGTQLWLLDRRGGEARAVSHVSGEISGYEWSPDGAHVVLVMSAEADSSARAKSGNKTVKPLVIDAFQFKQDTRGYLTAAVRTHLYLLDVRSGECAALTGREHARGQRARLLTRRPPDRLRRHGHRHGARRRARRYLCRGGAALAPQRASC